MARDHKKYHADNREKRNAQSAAWRVNNLERHREASKNHAANVRATDPIRYLLAKAKNRALEFGLDFDIDRNDVSIPFTCPLLGLVLYAGIGKPLPNSPTIDRKDTTKGYVHGNVWVVSYQANTMKNAATLDELKRFAKNVLDLL